MLGALLLALGLLLCGCQDTGEVENQAYVLVLALDRTDEGGLALTARVPKIGKSGAKDEKGGGDSPYLSFSVTGASWSRALDALQWATPRRINLSHIEMIVASEALASQPSFPELMNAVADTPHLYTNARFVVCQGSAKAFLEAGDTVIGTRLSSEIHAMLSQYARQGFIPDACLADACCCTNGIYGDAIAVWACLDESSTGQGGAAVADSPMRQRFDGTALFREGRFVMGLSAARTRLFNLIRGHGDAFGYAWRDDMIELVPEAAADRRVGWNGDAVSLALSVRLRAPDGFDEADTEALEAALRADMIDLIQACQRLGCEPFGFSEAAAAHFATVPQWIAFDWRAHYRRAPVDVDIKLTSVHTNP